MTLDTKAINYVLTHSHDYPKPEMTRFALSQIVGPGMYLLLLRLSSLLTGHNTGLLVVEGQCTPRPYCAAHSNVFMRIGEQHRQQVGKGVYSGSTPY